MQKNSGKDREKKQKDQVRYYKRSAKDLLNLTKGDVVRINPTKNSSKVWKEGVGVGRIDDGAYVVEKVEGTRYRRNRFHLRRTGESDPCQD